MAERKRERTPSLLSIEDAIITANQKRQDIGIREEEEAIDLPLELQVAIWSSVVAEMNVLDLLTIAWTPSWGVEGVRKILKGDEMWFFFWYRDFHKTGYCRGIPLTIPKFITKENRKDPDFEHFPPWKRYWIWTYYSLRTLSKIVLGSINQKALYWKKQYERDNLETGKLPPGVSMNFSVFRVQNRHCVNLDNAKMGLNQSWSVSRWTIGELISEALESAYSRKESELRVASAEFWEPENSWSLPVYMARFIIEMGFEKIGDYAVSNTFKNAQGNQKYILSWLVWCLRKSNGPNYDEEAPVDEDEPSGQGSTIREVLRWMADRLKLSIKNQFRKSQKWSAVPRTETVPKILFLGERIGQICFNCGKETTQVCGECKTMFYCSRECQTQDWLNGHNQKCALK